ncbi:MAG TPA: tripartite tricarboxylate transporter substrate binding protein [Xanthobacteraceae bacterium]|jgi:tripartite-type tricarboxylate transporter receptor subunit TctC|nr:tripartite tricarboxylate transporter substrate binding protein [Xanthobacteraceae bacterium]
MSFGVRAFGVLVILAAAALPAWGEVPPGFPAKPVKFVVPFPGGGINDVLARIAADKLTAKWGQPIVVENKTGAGGNIGADFAAQAEPDGHTLLITPPGPLAINQSLYRQLSYRPDDFVPITILAAITNLIIVRPDIGVNSVAELIASARQSPDRITYGSQGNGSTPHLTGSMFMTMTGTRMVHVPYRGENLVINDMLGGHVDVFFGNVAPALPHYRDGKLKVLAVADTKRAALMPDVPTAAEAGLPGFVSTSWFAVAGPPKMPPQLARRLARDFADVLSLPDVQMRYRSLGAEPVGTTPAETAAFIAAETARWREVIVKNNIRIE